jgi:hypothetical protein
VSTLFAGLVDDAAVFPPGLSPLDAAMVAHRVWRAGPIRDYLGPLLVPAERASELLPMLSVDEVDLALIGTPGGVTELIAAVRLLSRPGLRLVGVELPLVHDETDPVPTVRALAPLLSAGLTVSVEIGRRRPLDVLRSLAALPEVDDGLVRAKFRTGSVTGEDIPSFADLAAVLHTAVDAGIALKLTAGLHHAVAVQRPDGTFSHGVLNVITGVDAADRGASRSRIAAMLAAPDPADTVRRLDEARIAAVRSTFTSFGCCGVTEPLAEIAAQGLIPPLTSAVPA